MTRRREIPVSEFALQGGLLHRAGVRLGLVRRTTNVTALGLAIGLSYWVVLMLLLVLDGRNPSSIAYLDFHARFLVALPLLFAFESVFHPQVTQFIHGLVRAEILPPAQVVLLRRTFRSLRKWRDGSAPEIVCLLIATAVTIGVPTGHLSGIDRHAAQGVDAGWGLLGAWYLVGMTLFRFLLLRWAMIFAVWCFLLWRLARLPLVLKPSHIDRASGLGQLELVQAQFVPVMVATSCVVSASFAVDIHAGSLVLEEVVPMVLGLLLVDILLFVAPLALFTPKLWVCRLMGLHDFAKLSAAYAREFERKWVTNAGEGEKMLGSPDMSTYADLGAVANIVHESRVFPMTLRMAAIMAAATLVPLLPLLLFKYPGAVLIEQFLARLVGL
jgi:hypothetical protein